MVAKLAAADPTLARAVKVVGEFSLPRRVPSLHLLCASVIGQSISVKAAQTIVGRFSEAFGGPESLDARRLIKADREAIRSLGMNGTKAGAIQGIAQVWHEEGWTSDSVRLVPDEVLMERLTAVRGIGPWTVKMFLIFGLRRPDVFPEEDLGVREGLRLMDGLETRPTAREMLARADVWRPWRTVGTVLVWQYLLRASGTTLEETSSWWKD
jgi:DNA-3-methyladenine glycosylase II